MHTLTSKDFSGPASLETPGSRRVFIKGVGFVSLALIAGTLGGCEELLEAIRHRPTRRRLRVGSPEVDADIATYRQAVRAMKARGATDPRNWVAQATIHGTVAGGFNFCEHGNDHFFDWHRAYLFFFEKICQNLTGNSKFGLPYWNWNQNPDVHPAFLDPASSLFLARNRTSMNGSFSVTTATLDPIFADTNFFTFRAQLEGTPHNNVHTYIGATMGSGGSALDPLFWMHHCMVDYCWHKWDVDLGNNNTNDPTWINHVNSHFVDANGNPATETAGITTLMPLLSYQYESSAIGSAAAATPMRTKAEYQIVEKRLREGADIHFVVTRRVRLSERASAAIGRPLSLETKLSAEDFARIINGDSARERVFASIAYAELPATSDFTVRVFVNLPNATRVTPNTDPHYAGAFTFFGSQPPKDAAGTGQTHRHQPQFLVDLTAAIQRLRKTQELKSDSPLSLQLVPTPFAEKFEREDTELVLSGVDIITTPVIVRAAPP